jgi:ribosomal protein S26
MSGKHYTRGWSHTKSRGRENTVNCGFCGKLVPRYKTFPIVKGIRINDPMLRGMPGWGIHGLNMMQSKIYACPACARHRSIVRKR